MAGWRRPPITAADCVVTLLIYIAACGSAWVLAGFVPEYRALAGSGDDTRFLPLAFAVAWLGIGPTLLLVPLWTLRAVRLRQRAWSTALVAFPLLAESWVLGLLAAVVAVSC
ncbi:hypothetical protein [Nocardia sp. NPDC059228]|uniref:hypothetical protein n=1 Tax=Nocardia sp. NPDC059228 TaxID=3346777 RepID=UPI0036B9CA27